MLELLRPNEHVYRCTYSAVYSRIITVLRIFPDLAQEPEIRLEQASESHQDSEAQNLVSTAHIIELNTPLTLSDHAIVTNSEGLAD